MSIVLFNTTVYQHSVQEGQIKAEFFFTVISEDKLKLNIFCKNCFVLPDVKCDGHCEFANGFAAVMTHEHRNFILSIEKITEIQRGKIR